MPKLIKNHSVIDAHEELLAKDFAGELFNNGHQGGEHKIVPLTYWLANAEALVERPDIGVWIDSDEGPEELAPFVSKLSLIAVNFPSFRDGRGYSTARLLRERYGFKGELRAIGDVLHDQLFYMKRCGIDTFAIREDKDAQAAMAGLNDFSNWYQGATDDPLPLFRRRSF